METNKREFIDPNDLMQYINENHCYSGLPMAAHICTMELLTYAPRVDAVPVDEIRLHHILIDNEGVPEVKLQIGDRYFVLHTDPVDVTKVVHGRWERTSMYDEDSSVQCSECLMEFDYIDGMCYLVTGSELPLYCPNCGAKMDLK